MPQWLTDYYSYVKVIGLQPNTGGYMTGSKKRILIVDDAIVANAMKSNFKEYDGMEVFVAYDLGTAIDMIQKVEFEVVVIEHSLSYGSAYELLKGMTDPGMFKGADRLIEFVRKYVRDNTKFVLIGSNAVLLEQTRQKHNILAEYVFEKPFSDFLLEYVVCDILGVECKLPEDLIRAELNVWS